MKKTTSTSDRLPTATATPIRLQVFQPTRRPKQLVRTIETAFGSVSVDGRLGQAHADLLECVMFHSVHHEIIRGRLGVLVDPYRIRKAMGGGQAAYSGGRIKDFERDLLRAVMTVETPKIEIRGHILDKVVEAKTTATDPRKWLGTASAERHFQLWVFSEEWTKLVREDIGRFYDPAPLCRIEHGSVSALARHVLTHQHQPNGGWKLEGLIKAAGVERRQDKVRQEMRGSAAALAEVGIQIDGDRVFLAAPATSMSAPATTMSAPATISLGIVRTGHRF